MIWYYDWEGNHKIVTCGAKYVLVGPDAGLMDFSHWFNHNYGRPSITSVYAVSEEFYNEFREQYRGAGYLFEGDGNNGGEL